MPANPYIARVYRHIVIAANPRLVRVYENPGYSAPPLLDTVGGSKNTQRYFLSSGQKVLTIGPLLARV